MVICSVACPFHINSTCAHIRCFRVRARLVPTMFRRVICPTSKKNLPTHSRRRAQRSSAPDTCPMDLTFFSVTNYFDSARFFPTSVIDTYVVRLCGDRWLDATKVEFYKYESNDKYPVRSFIVCETRIYYEIVDNGQTMIFFSVIMYIGVMDLNWNNRFKLK